MRRLLWMAIVVILTVAPRLAAGQGLATEEFDARPLSTQERRVVQAALALSGDYVGLLDGVWGRGSQSALERYAQRTAGTTKPQFGHLAPLLRDLQTEIGNNGWQMLHFESTNTSYAHPFGLLSRHPNQTVMRYDAADGRLTLFVDFEDLDTVLAIHGYFLREAASVPEPYQNVAPGRIITSVTLADGLLAYVRSDAAGAGFVTLSIIAGSEHRGRLALMAASMQRGSAAELAVPRTGLLAAIAGIQPIPQPKPIAPPVAAAPDTAFRAGGSPDGSGTGFYINNTDLVTAAHVVDGCARLALTDGSPLQVIATDEALDLAVLTSPVRSPVWLEVSDTAEARLGEQVLAIGYPYLGSLGQGLTVTGGNVSALQGVDGGADRIMISAPVQPGNSGGPLLNAAGAVIGVVVSRVDDLTILERTGTLPQNMNFATPNGLMSGFLRRAQVLFPEAAEVGFDLSRGIPDRISAAVVPVFCFN